MQSKRGRGEQKLESALADLAAALDATGIPWMVIGGIAVIARGVRRMTTDIDATVRGDRLEVAALVKALAKKRIVPRIENAERFALDSLVLLLKHRPTGVELDVSMAWTDFEHQAIAGASVTAFGRAKAPMAQAEDLLVFKAVAARPKDIEDATALLVLYPRIDRAHVRQRVRQLAALAEDAAAIDALEAAMAAAGAPRPPAARKRPKRTSAATHASLRVTKPGSRRAR